MHAYRDHRPAGVRPLPRSVLLSLLFVAAGADAQVVFGCRDAAGHVAYQDQACAAGLRETRIELAKPPPPAPPPDYGVARAARAAGRMRPRRRVAGAQRESAPVSYECRADDGEVFYRHAGCPHSLRIPAGSGKGARSATVSAVPLARSEACRRLAAAGSIGRSGHQHDERVSTYERNAGRDPCRW